MDLLNVFPDANRNMVMKLVIIYRALYKAVGKEIADLDLTTDQDSLLQTIAAKGSLTLAEIAQVLVREPTSVTQFVNRLEARRYLEKEKIEGSNLKIVLGENAKRNWNPELAAKVLDKVMNTLTKEEKVQLNEILNRLVKSSIEELDALYRSPFIID
ncbi:MarR family winged helix-turn-helix transcriptional regulator [Dehalococcoides mccartyi]|uniref:MarR family winged helix-turn-helix transcriptional regulator n=1 Tax=Dehalococcoides mccartyi TaxID=61435 RepID=UPI0003C82379|nr:MarR family transcriptional regulator [Dehalococcoides mccartyi]AHB14120.1 MarR family transcriptional regulator [Dehalococcoides mccartyi GY50]APH13027.1 hypothetical protein ASJ33_07595 [Dehalococcoides mccartyi]